MIKGHLKYQHYPPYSLIKNQSDFIVTRSCHVCDSIGTRQPQTQKNVKTSDCQNANRVLRME